MLGEHYKRSHIEVMADILRIGEAGKTEIMYDANLSYIQAQKYLRYLTDGGFLVRVVVPNPGVKYRITKKGERLLNRIDVVLNMLDLKDQWMLNSAKSAF